MLIFLALLYFCLACSLIFLLGFPAGRAAILQCLYGHRVTDVIDRM